MKKQDFGQNVLVMLIELMANVVCTCMVMYNIDYKYNIIYIILYISPLLKYLLSTINKNTLFHYPDSCTHFSNTFLFKKGTYI